jgi:hypothetical protein
MNANSCYDPESAHQNAEQPDAGDKGVEKRSALLKRHDRNPYPIAAESKSQATRRVSSGLGGGLTRFGSRVPISPHHLGPFASSHRRRRY